jgi:thiamine transporter
MQEFFESTYGKLVVAVIVIVLLLIIMLSGGKDKKKTDLRALSVTAMMVALSMVLSMITIFKMPQGGSVTLFSILPIVACAYLLGPRDGIIAGICVGLINLMIGPYVIHPVQLLLDYPIAFGALGIGGVLRNRKNGLTLAYIVGVFCRYICAVMSGIIFFGEYAPENFNAVTWSLWYNLTYLSVEAVITIIVINIPAVKRMFESFRVQLSN